MIRSFSPASPIVCGMRGRYIRYLSAWAGFSQISRKMRTSSYSTASESIQVYWFLAAHALQSFSISSVRGSGLLSYRSISTFLALLLIAAMSLILLSSALSAILLSFFRRYDILHCSVDGYLLASPSVRRGQTIVRFAPYHQGCRRS